MTPIIGITMGDPAGVGPEIIVKALSRMPPEERAQLRIYGNRDSLAQAERFLATPLPLAPDAFHDTPIAGGAIAPGKLDPRAGDASFRFIAAAVKDAISGAIACIVTAPINKAALNAAGHHYDGHTGMLAHLTGAPSSFMLLASERLNVIHNSTHVSLRTAIDRARPERELATIRAGHHHLRRLGMERPRIAVAGLNPHCGENGLFGTEDDEHIAPAVALARAEGIDAHGPISADTLFHRAWNGAFDLVVAQYHDQGHIPIKLIAFDTALNVSIGLPIDRCSVDHGTAFDIAGKGIANSVNLDHAIAYARRLAAHPRARQEIFRMSLAVTGVYSAAATPVNADLGPNLDAFAAHCRWLLDEGCDGIALLGTIGEANSFSLAECRAILEAALAAEIAPGRLLPGTATSNLPETIELTRHATGLGVKAVVLLPPFYYKGIDDDGLFAFYSRVIEGVADDRLRVLLYHIPQVSAVPIGHDLIASLIDAFPGIVVGIKDSAGDIANMQAMIARFPGFSVLAGADPLLLPLMREGGAGAITATANLVARDLVTVFRGANDPAQTAAVEAAQARINAFRALSQSYVQIPTIKAMIAARTGDPGWLNIRPPLLPLDAAASAVIRAKFGDLPAAA